MIHGKEKKAGDGKSALSYFNMSSHYERTARLLPGLLCAMTLLPVGAAFGLHVEHYLGLAATGFGIWAVCGVGISHLASAAGNRLQRKLWPRWPHDSPTNRWLLPEDRTRSMQQKNLIYGAIKRLVSLDVKSAAKHGPGDLEATINDAVSRLRYNLRATPQADRLDSHNAQYGFARNFTGLRPLWLSFLTMSAAGCWIAHAKFAGAMTWCVASTGLLVAAIPISLCMNQYVQDRAWHYAESFFSAVLEMDGALHPSPEKDKEPAKTRKTKQLKSEEGEAG